MAEKAAELGAGFCTNGWSWFIEDGESDDGAVLVDAMISAAVGAAAGAGVVADA